MAAEAIYFTNFLCIIGAEERAVAEGRELNLYLSVVTPRRPARLTFALNPMGVPRDLS